MSEHTAGPVVVGVDGSSGARDALRWAAGAAAARAVPLRVVHAFVWRREYLAMASDPVRAERDLRQRAAEILEHAASCARQAVPGVDVATRLVDGRAGPALLHECSDASLAVVGPAAGCRLPNIVIGSVATVVTHHADCPVVVVRDVRPDGPVVVGADGSPSAEPALAFAFAEAARQRRPLVAVRAWPQGAQSYLVDPTYHGVSTDVFARTERAHLMRTLAPWQDRYPDVEVTPRLARGRAAPGLVRASAGAHLLVVGTRGHGGIGGLLLGSVSQAVLHHAPCTVAVVPRSDRHAHVAARC